MARQPKINKLLSANEAQAYLVSFGVPVKSRDSFYRYIERFDIKFFDMTPDSRKTTRQFQPVELNRFLVKTGYLDSVSDSLVIPLETDTVAAAN